MLSVLYTLQHTYLGEDVPIGEVILLFTERITGYKKKSE